MSNFSEVIFRCENRLEHGVDKPDDLSWLPWRWNMVILLLFVSLLYLTTTAQIIYVSTAASWENAQSDCQSQGSNLLTASNANSANIDECTSAAASRAVNVWTGLNKRDDGVNWKWASGETYVLSQTNWASNDPDDDASDGSCAVIKSFGGNKHKLRNNNKLCTMKFIYCCDPIPETPPILYPPPSVDPTPNPSVIPSKTPKPSVSPSKTPKPKISPSLNPTTDPTNDPTGQPSNAPIQTDTVAPSVDPTTDPTIEPTLYPTVEPTIPPNTCCQCLSVQSDIIGGCDKDKLCETHICESDVWCCRTHWDRKCVDAATSVCTSQTRLPSVSPTLSPVIPCCGCTNVAGRPGCDGDAICQANV